MKILYLSCHSILEYDEVKLLRELGHEVFSLGAYTNGAGDGKRPALDATAPSQLQDVAIQSSKEKLHPELIKWADVILVMHVPDWIERNWEAIKHKKVIWRTIGQSVWHVEQKLQPYRDEGLLVVRYSPLEKNIPNFIGEDALIRFYKDPAEFGPWNGRLARALNFTQSMKQRYDPVHGDSCHWLTYKEVAEAVPLDLWGPGNEDSGMPGGGAVSYEDQKKYLCNYRAYFYTGTEPASYTLNFVEAFMTGIPIVALGKGLGNKMFDQDTYEVPEIIEHGVSGYVSDDPEELKRYLRLLLSDKEHARAIGEAGRARAIELFGKETVAADWSKFLEHLG